MTAYDFDNTIYDGESPIDFFIFCLKKKKSLIRFLPLILYSFILYKMRLLTIDKLLEAANKMTSVFLKNNEKLDEIVQEFWDKNKRKLKTRYLSKLKKDDIIITAAPRFLIEGILSILKTKNIICSEFNIETAKFEFANFGKNKVISFKEKYPNEKIVNFYTDSLNDLPLIEIAENSFLVKGNKEPVLINKDLIKKYIKKV